MYLMINISNMFLAQCWRLETGCSPFYDFNKITSKFEWMLDDIRIEKIILVPIWATNFFEVSALPDVRHCLKLQSCAISRDTNNDAILKKCQKP